MTEHPEDVKHGTRHDQQAWITNFWGSRSVCGVQNECSRDERATSNNVWSNGGQRLDPVKTHSNNMCVYQSRGMVYHLELKFTKTFPPPLSS